jgi:hypothetical protein
LGRRRLGLDGREHGSTLDWHGAKQACQLQPSNDVADALSMCVIVLRGIAFNPLTMRWGVSRDLSTNYLQFHRKN